MSNYQFIDIEVAMMEQDFQSVKVDVEFVAYFTDIEET